MNELHELQSLPVLLVGSSIVIVVLLKNIFERCNLPPLVAYLIYGLLLRVAGDQTGMFTNQVIAAFDILAKLGIVALLFRVGLHSHPRALLAKLPQASVIWLGNFMLAAALGYFAAYYLLGLSGIASMFVAAALSTTSVGVAVAAWEDADLLESGTGQLVLDVAELDDISGIAFMALLLALVPVLSLDAEKIWGVVATTSITFVLKFALFIIGCVLFAHHLEPRLTAFVSRLHAPPERMLLVAGVGFVIAAIAGSLGFSLAIGALFAGLVFSSDPEAIKTELSFESLYSFLTPFFFISLGMNIDPSVIGDALWPGLLLFLVAVAGKVLGAGLASYPLTAIGGMIAIGVSMVPRAEISLLIIHQANQWPDIVPDSIYAAVVIVSALTCLLTPFVLQWCFRRWHRELKGST